MNDRIPVVKDGKSLNKLDPLSAYAASIDFQGEPKHLPSPNPSSSPSPVSNPNSSQVLPASATVPK
jgi:hypothetical protein